MKISREYHINNSTVRIIFGNILESNTDIIANSSGLTLTMSGGLTKSIRKAGGGEIQQDAQRKLPVKVGDAVVTTVGRLRQKYIFHCITHDKSVDHSHTLNSISNQDLDQYIIEHSVNKCFQLLHAMELTSIAFSSLGAGAAKIPFKKVAETMATVIAKNLRKTNRSILVEIYLYDRFGEMTDWDYMPMFEQFAKQEGKTELIKERISEDLLIDEEHHTSDNPHLPDPDSEVFISYSRKDIDIVKPIYEMLEKSGIKCWLDATEHYHPIF